MTFATWRLMMARVEIVNLEYNTLVRLADGTNISSSKGLVPSIIFLQNSLQKSFQLIFL